MTAVTRRGWMAMMGAAPLAGGVVAWGEKKRSDGALIRTWQDIDPREMIRQRHFPDVELLTHEGRRVRLYTDLVKDRKVVINMMYVGCARICSTVTSNLVRVRNLLGERVGREIFFYSITLKPKEDSRSVLARYAKAHGIDDGWLFLTGTPRDIESVRRALGFVYDDPVEDADTANHTGMLRYGNEPMMRWGTCPGQANPEHIVKSLLWDLG